MNASPYSFGARFRLLRKASRPSRPWRIAPYAALGGSHR